MKKEVKMIELELADMLENMQMLQNRLTSKLFNRIKTHTLFTEDTNEDGDEEWIQIKGYNIHIRVYTKISFIGEATYQMALKDGYDALIAALEYEVDKLELRFSFNRNRLEEINRSETCIARKEKQMTKIPFSQELREKYNLGPATEQDYQSEYIERELTELKKYLSKMAERKRVELSIFFVGYPTDGDMFNFRYNIPKSAYNMQPDMKKAAVKFLTDEDFYFIEWHNHIVVNLVKKPHVVGDAKCN